MILRSGPAAMTEFKLASWACQADHLEFKLA